jgi:hypothetical protein
MARGNPSNADWQAVMKIGLKEVVAETAKAHRWSPTRAERAELWYRRHLYLARKNKGTSLGLLAKDADAVWHHHIVNTRKYRADCDSLFEGYLDHAPGLNVKAKSTAREMYMMEFGQDPPGPTDDCWTPW